MEILEQIEPLTESIGRETNDLRELLDGLTAYALTVKTQKSQKFLLDIIKQIKNIAENIDNCASTIYGKAERANVEQQDTDELEDKNNALREILREYVGNTTDRREQNYIKSRYGVDVTAY